MALKFSVILYGADTDVTHDSNGTALVTALEAIPAEELPLEVYWVTPTDKMEGDQVTVPGGQKFFYGIMRGSEQLITKNYSLTDYETARQALRGIVKKKYTWLEVTEFPADIHTAGRAIAVAIIGISVETKSGLKQFSIDLEHRFGY